MARVAVTSGPVLKAGGWPPVSDRALADGDLVSLHVRGWSGGYAFSASQAAVVGQASPHQREQLRHAEEAAQYMVETLQPDRRWAT